MRISDWSPDVCSSDLGTIGYGGGTGALPSRPTAGVAGRSRTAAGATDYNSKGDCGRPCATDDISWCQGTAPGSRGDGPCAQEGADHGHAHDEGRGEPLLQGLGQRAAGGVKPRLDVDRKSVV